MTQILRFATLLFALAINAPRLHSADTDEDLKLIFNCKDLTGWDGNPKFWCVQDGVITGQTTKENPTDHNTFLIWRAGKVDDFELHAKIRLVGGNSGIQYRSKEFPDWVIGGYQADFDADNTYSGILYEERGRGILANRGEKVIIRDNGKPDVVGSVGDPKKIRDANKK